MTIATPVALHGTVDGYTWLYDDEGGVYDCGYHDDAAAGDGIDVCVFVRIQTWPVTHTYTLCGSTVV